MTDTPLGDGQIIAVKTSLRLKMRVFQTALERGRLLSRRFGLFVAPKSRPVFADFLERAFSAGGKKQTCEVELLKSKNESLWGQIEAASDDAGETCRAVVVDVSGLKRVEEALRASEDKFRYFFDHSAIGKSLTSPGGEINVNQSLCGTLGYTMTELKNTKWQDITHAEDIELTQREMDRLLSGKQDSVRFVKRFIHKDGSVVWMDLSSSRRLDADGKPLYLMTSMIDITERRQADQALKYLSTHDELTGLYNRSFFVAEMMRQERGREFPLSIVMADVDGLKKTNDKEGHAAGDSVLKRIAEVLTTAFRSEDVIARMGGDEFAVLLPATDATSAKTLLERVRQVIHDSNAAHAETHLSLSLGVSTAEKPIPLSVVLQRADVNMYREKRGNAAAQKLRGDSGHPRAV